MVDPQTQQAIDTVKILWAALGVLIASNAGTIIKIILDRKEKLELKSDAEQNKRELEKQTAINEMRDAIKDNTKAVQNISFDLQRLYTATKLLAGPKWAKISKTIQEEQPRNQ